MTFDPNRLPKTRQGVRDLNNVGSPIRRQNRAHAPRQTCPPHLPGPWSRDDDYGFTLLRRCLACKVVVDQQDAW